MIQKNKPFTITPKIQKRRIYSQQLDFWRGASERDEGVYRAVHDRWRANLQQCQKFKGEEYTKNLGNEWVCRLLAGVSLVEVPV